jgi:energy-coupling factor transport system permease protein
VIGYVPGRSPLHRAHPYTPLALATALMLLAFAAPTPGTVAAVLAWALALAVLGDAARQVARPVALLALPTGALLLVLHGLLGPEPRVNFGGLTLSPSGLERALVLGGRLTAIVIAFTTALVAVSPPRLVEAMTARGVSFARIFLLASTLTLLPRMRERAARILEAQRCRGLEIGGSPLARARALGPLVLPLVLGALAEVDEQVLALDARGAMSGAQRTALDPPQDSDPERALRWSLLVVVTAAYGYRFLGTVP